MKYFNKFAVTFFMCLLVSVATTAEARKSYGLEQAIKTGVKAYNNSNSFTVPSQGYIEVAFSPDEGGENLVLKVINSATQNISMLSYSFTSKHIVEALIEARRRGVNITLVADYKNNISQDSSGKAQEALSELQRAGGDVRTISVYPIHHDKVIIVDRKTVELGSFNYSEAAAHKNSENVFVNWNNPQLAEVYLGHFNRNLKQSTTL